MQLNDLLDKWLCGYQIFRGQYFVNFDNEGAVTVLFPETRGYFIENRFTDVIEEIRFLK